VPDIGHRRTAKKSRQIVKLPRSGLVGYQGIDRDDIRVQCKPIGVERPFQQLESMGVCLESINAAVLLDESGRDRRVEPEIRTMSRTTELGCRKLRNSGSTLASMSQPSR
jgi:hypothetical protein